MIRKERAQGIDLGFVSGWAFTFDKLLKQGEDRVNFLLDLVDQVYVSHLVASEIGRRKRIRRAR